MLVKPLLFFLDPLKHYRMPLEYILQGAVASPPKKPQGFKEPKNEKGRSKELVMSRACPVGIVGLKSLAC